MNTLHPAILFLRTILVLILLALLAVMFAGSAKGKDMPEPGFQPNPVPPAVLVCVNPEKVERACIKVGFKGKIFLLVLTEDGTEVVAVLKLNEADGTTELVYEVPPTQKV